MQSTNFKNGIDALAALPQKNNLTLRILSALFIAAFSVFFLSLGFPYAEVFVVFVAIGIVVEWSFMCYHSPFPKWKKIFIHGAGVLYILGAIHGIFKLFALEKGYGLFIAVVVIICMSDSGAYFTGRRLQGPKLAPHISPNKTWSGAIGGFLSAIMTGLLANHFFHFKELTLGLIILIAVVAQGGDLLESWVKRRFKVKDSSQLIPGHGGLLDRLDSLLAVGVLMAIWTFLS
jgi:phosphatidate cytidylyltransferase